MSIDLQTKFVEQFIFWSKIKIKNGQLPFVVFKQPTEGNIPLEFIFLFANDAFVIQFETFLEKWIWSFL